MVSGLARDVQEVQRVGGATGWRAARSAVPGQRGGSVRRIFDGVRWAGPESGGRLRSEGFAMVCDIPRTVVR